MQCRACKNQTVWEKLKLGEMTFSGIFKPWADKLPSGTLTLMECQSCSLVQLKESFDPEVLYGPTYGYRSGLNASMRVHLWRKAAQLIEWVELMDDDVVIDIGSSDGTLLNEYPDRLVRIGFDPQANRFAEFYDEGIQRVPEFFSFQQFTEIPLKQWKAKIITSIAMFYDLDDPVAFAREVADILHEDGVWNIEMHYLNMLAFDAVCHEHLTYYNFKSLRYVLGRAGLKIVDVSFNAVNGGSMSVIAVHQDSPHSEVAYTEEAFDWRRFQQSIFDCKTGLMNRLEELKREGKTIHALGASTKGGVLLQHCGLVDTRLIGAVSDVNPDKHGCMMPGTTIPIVSEAHSWEMEPDVYLVLPWHFKEGIVRREREVLGPGDERLLIFPLPAMNEVNLRGASQ